MSTFRNDLERLPEIAESVDKVGEVVCASVIRARSRWAKASSSQDADEALFMAGFAVGLVMAGRPDLLSSYPSARAHATHLGLLREDGTPVI